MPSKKRARARDAGVLGMGRSVAMGEGWMARLRMPEKRTLVETTQAFHVLRESSILGPFSEEYQPADALDGPRAPADFGLALTIPLQRQASGDAR